MGQGRGERKVETTVLEQENKKKETGKADGSLALKERCVERAGKSQDKVTGDI